VRPAPIITDDAGYQRPNQPWVCGLACEGRACPAGPTTSGICPALAECSPRRDGDRWLCNRSDLRGGPCDGGPTPEGGCGCVQHCQPVRSLRAKRGRFVMLCMLGAAAALMLILSASWRDEVLAPGPLNASHAQLLRREGAGPQCAACHAAAADGMAGWAAPLVFGHGERPSQSQLCMNCHERTIQRELALVAHNVPPRVLQVIRQGDEQPGTQREIDLRKASRTLADADESLACAACHREHHGAAFDLTALDNAACQTCHQRPFDRFAGNHPDFVAWPYERRTRIAFDHASHSAKHFPKEKTTFDCRICHVVPAATTKR
jgi:hypothetical protein